MVDNKNNWLTPSKEVFFDELKVNPWILNLKCYYYTNMFGTQTNTEAFLLMHVFIIILLIHSLIMYVKVS